MLGFGLVIPDIQLRGDSLGAEGAMRGLLLATFSIAQLTTAPLLGRLSDRRGRRPILLATTLLSAASFLFYAHADALWAIFASRFLGGVAAANIGIAYAYIADVTTPSERAKGMGLIGAAFGLGFIFGPVLGANLVAWGGGGPRLLGYVAATMALANSAYVALLLPESRHRDAGVVAGTRRGGWHHILIALRTPQLGTLLALFFVANFGFANLESTYFLLAVQRFGLTQTEGAYVLAFVGVLQAFVQGFLVRVATPRFGEVALLRFAYCLQAPALALIPFATPWAAQLLCVGLLGLGSGLGQPSMGSLVSRHAPRDMQGGIFGVTQSLGAMARILGPLCGNALFDVRPYLPYLVAGAVTLVPLGAAFRFRASPTDAGPAEPSAVS